MPAKTRALAVFLAAFVMVGTSCTSSQTASQSPTSTASGTPTPPCDPYTLETTRVIVTRFLDAYNAGAPDITERFIAPPGEFQWYGAPGRQFPDDPASANRGSLPAYFTAQHAKGDRLELKVFGSSGAKYYPPGSGGWMVNFSYILVHSVASGTAHDAPGKGALSCASGKIAVWLIESW